MRNYGTQVEQYYAAHIRKSNGKAYVYYKFRIGKKTGWVWHGYLKPFTSGTTAPTTGTTGTSTNSGTDLVPVANANWNKIGATGVFAADSTLMQMFPNTTFSKYLYSAVQGYNNMDDGVDRPNYFDTSWSNTMKSKLGVQSTAKPVYIYASVSEPEPFTKANIEAALTKAGYDANARAKFSGWYIGGSIEPDSWADEGAYGGMTTIVLVPQS
ncbi:hypothetical protein [Secundilactobacillus folii]|uniref:Uncharacterized protein n=1 Tax=Secundilactobacillus folii TaxID=2678357 RepID=A0A7X2XVP8_9LACO|nr:hypothetical protein [Secundilactobacillus folii]MTV81778.1 hypothetical protein [Secundilactobacillus folii]